MSARGDCRSGVSRQGGIGRELVQGPGMRTPDRSRDAIIACSPQLRGTPTDSNRRGDAALHSSKHDACQFDNPLIHRTAAVAVSPRRLRNAEGLFENPNG
jgi:hypothetical protein